MELSIFRLLRNDRREGEVGVREAVESTVWNKQNDDGIRISFFLKYLYYISLRVAPIIAVSGKRKGRVNNSLLMIRNNVLCVPSNAHPVVVIQQPQRKKISCCFFCTNDEQSFLRAFLAGICH